MPEVEGTTATIPQEAPAPAPAPESTPAVDTINPDPDSNLKDLAFLVDESDLPPAGMRGPQSRFAIPTPEAGNAQVTTGQPQQPEAQAQQQQPETAQERAERLFAGKYKTPEELEHGYIESQKMAHEKAQELARMKEQFGASDPQVIQRALQLENWYQTTYLPWAAQQNYLAAQAQQQQGQPQQGTDTAQAERPKPFMEMTRDETLDAFSEDPKTLFMQGVKEVLTQNPQIVAEILAQNPQIVEAVTPEIGQQRAADKIFREYSSLEAAHPDAGEVLPMMTEIYKQDPRLKQAPMEVVYRIAKGFLYDQMMQNQQVAVQSAAEIATQKAYELQKQKVQGGIEGAQSIEPGIGSAPDDLESFLQWNESRKVRVV